jgi:hypothetical protein
MEGPSHGHVGNDAARPRDPTTEQGLEADATVLIPSTYATPATVWHGRRNPGRHANGKKATTAVTRNGCRRGSSFEGSELRCGDLATAPARHHPPVGWGRCPERASKKRSEPHDRQRDATSPQTSRRRKPSKWCKTTRTEQDFRSGPPRAEARRARRAGVDAWSRRRWRGERRVVRSAGRATRMNPTREGLSRPGREASALKRSQGHEGPHRAVFGLCGRGAHEPRGWDRQRSTTAEVARKSNRLATCVTRAAVDCRKAGAAPRALKVG